MEYEIIIDKLETFVKKLRTLYYKDGNKQIKEILDKAEMDLFNYYEKYWNAIEKDS